MNPRIIALRGRGYGGKTTTLRLLADILPNQDWTRVSRELHGNQIDIIDVYEDANGNRLGVASAGDHYDEVEPALRKLVAAGCTVIVCACRTKDMPNADGEYKGTHAAMYEFTEDVTFVNKTIIDVEDKVLRDQANQSDVQRLLNLI